MALQACRECGRMVSTEAKACPQCGVPRPTHAANAEDVEDIVYRAHVHPIIYGWSVVATAAFILSMVIAGIPVELRWVFGVLAAITWLVTLVIAKSVQFVVTERRVTTRTGILHRNSQETLLEKVETVGVDQDLLGRILGYGTVTVVGTGGSQDEFKRISKPLQLRRALHDEIERRKG